ncbi:MAG: selenocysteine-specific translation elongation factor [Nitrospira sp.]|nr:selenocysteine-specific translation elongation factor [Nitrospira sp.]
MRYIILGTAGHIDHGKSAIVKALTGIDPDRLKEEKERGMTIDLGFADLKYPDGLTVGIVDVPGHESLVRNMLAGAGGIDLVLFVIAADEGVMPQSREHLHICNLLKIKSGIIAITKVDLVEKDWLELVEDDVRNFVKGTFLEGAVIVPASSKTMFNIDLLKEKIQEVALRVEPKPTGGLFRLPVDRVFTLKGFGTVVTGTAISGTISVDDVVEILPSNIKSKVRGLHSHGKSIQTAYAGQRVAINLQGVDKEGLKRGDAVVVPERCIPSTMIDARIELLQNAQVLKNRDVIHLHIGTSESMARIVLYSRNELKACESCYCQFRLQEPIVAMSGDRYIIRRFSPVDTIGGGEVLDPSSYKMSHKKSLDDLNILDSGTLSDKIALKVKRAGIHGTKISLIEGWIKEEVTTIKHSIEELIEKNILQQYDDILFHTMNVNTFSNLVKNKVENFHRRNPLKPGIQKEELRANLNIEPRLFNYFIKLLKDIVVENETVRLSTFTMVLSRSDENLKQQILEILEKTGLQPATKEELVDILKVDHRRISDILKLLAKEGNLVRINDSLYITSSVYKNMVERLKEFFMSKSEMSVKDFKATVNAPRKYAITFLEYLDMNRITKRVGDVRKFMYNG